MDNNWTKTKTALPPVGVPVATMSDSGWAQNLVRLGNLWWSPDKSRYVSYTPQRWRLLADT